MTLLLKSGSTGPNVQLVQTLLNFVGAAKSPLVADGIFGPKTLAAVLQFQKSAKLSADGIVGPLTMQALAGTVAVMLFTGKTAGAA
jgi:peptidoglycan hydrolase-like protein with peptidoglycan-binding domain